MIVWPSIVLGLSVLLPPPICIPPPCPPSPLLFSPTPSLPPTPPMFVPSPQSGNNEDPPLQPPLVDPCMRHLLQAPSSTPGTEESSDSDGIPMTKFMSRLHVSSCNT